MRFACLPPLLVVVVFASCVTPTSARGQPSTRLVVVDGTERLAEDVAYELVRDAERREDLSAKKEALRRVVDEFADTRSRGRATVALARLLLDEKNKASAAEAQRALERFLLEEPTDDDADDARALLAMAQMGQTGGQSSAPAIQSIVDKLAPDAQGPALLKLGRELVSVGKAKDGLVALLTALPKLAGPDRKAAEDDVVFALDVPAATGGVAFSEVRALKEAHAAKDPFVDEVLTWKLAVIAHHQKDAVGSQALAKDLVKRFPTSRFAKDATALIGRLQARVETNPRVVGVILPLTGEYAAYGKRALTAVRLAFNLGVNEDKPMEPVLDEATGELVVPKKAPEQLTGTLTTPGGLKLVIKDSAGKTDKAQRAVTELVEQEHAIAILGDILVDTSLPIALAAEDYGVPVLSLSRRDGVPEAGPWSFRLALTPRKQAQALADFAVDGLKLKRFAIMYPKHSFGVELMNEFWTALDARHAEITAIESYAHDQTTFTNESKSLVGRGMGIGSGREVTECREEARKIDNDYRRKKALEGCNDKAKPIIDFEALFIPDGYRAVSFVVPALISEDVLLTNHRATVEAYKKATSNDKIRPVQLLGASTWNDPDIATRLGRQVDGAVFIDGFNASDQTPLVQKFVEGFQKATRTRPALVEAQTFDGARLLGALLEGQGPAGVVDKPQTRAALQKALNDVNGFVGVTGTIDFDDEGDSKTPLHFFQIEREKVEHVERDELLKGAG
ncbi:MAG: ABC transporter substrate-binding protein [Deltaproteobacteria bacterium]|nr:ABC transporter substrate-binding protein [Deltaproteobacteria bacterium]